MCSSDLYEPNDPDYGLPKAERYASFGMEPPTREIVYDGTEGELYHLEEDPHQWVNRWDDPTVADVRERLVRDLHEHLPPAREPRLRPMAMG